MAHHSPAARAPGTPQDRGRTTPPDLSALAVNDHQDRVLARVIRAATRSAHTADGSPTLR